MILLVSEVKSYLCLLKKVFKLCLKCVATIFEFKKCVTNTKSLEGPGLMNTLPSALFCMLKKFVRNCTNFHVIYYSGLVRVIHKFLGHGPLFANLFYHGPQSYATSIFCPTNEKR